MTTTVGIRELESNLGRYLESVKQGAVIRIKDRGQEVMELRPISHERQIVQELVDQKAVTWNGKKPTGLRGILNRGASVAEAVLEDRR